MCPLTNNWRPRRTDHRFNAEITMDIKTQNSEHTDTYSNKKGDYNSNKNVDRREYILHEFCDLTI